MPLVDELLCTASKTQLRNVLALANLTDAELISLFELERQMTAKESLS
jgi:hypothetical protein